MKKLQTVFLVFAVALSMTVIFNYPACAEPANREVLYTQTSEGTFLKYEIVDYGHFDMIDNDGNTLSFFCLRNVGVNLNTLEKGKSIRVTWQHVKIFLDPPGHYVTIDELLSVKVLGAPNIILDGTELSFDVPPIIDNGRILVPLRTIFEAMGAEVNWDSETMTATAVKGSTTVVFKIGSLAPTINGTVKPIDVAGKIVNGRTLAPLRFVAEAFGGAVDWDAGTQTAVIKSSQASTNTPTNNTSLKDTQGMADKAYDKKIAEYINSSSYYDKYFGYTNKQLYYAKYDIDKDTIPELIVRTGKSAADMRCYVHTYKNGKLIDVGSFGGASMSLYAIPDRNGMLSVHFKMGGETGYEITLYNDTINSTNIFKKDVGTGEYDSFPNEIEMTTVF